MGIESTKSVKKRNAINFLQRKGVIVYEDDCCNRLSDLMYEYRDNDFENYCVYEKHEEYIVNDDDFNDWEYEYE